MDDESKTAIWKLSKAYSSVHTYRIPYAIVKLTNYKTREVINALGNSEAAAKRAVSLMKCKH